ncbi:MAG TPA: sulfotransferase [Verrucomicrobiae bacterium]|nr:sulfotransferase [Verrucomicrobiae bacterium]
MQDQPASPSQNAPRVLFVIGLWRSGTSLIHALLNRHPQIALMYEAEPMELWPCSPGVFHRKQWPQRLEFFNQTFTRHNLDSSAFAETLPGPTGAMALYREYGRVRGANIIGEKAPSYHTRVPSLGRLFPNAQFLIIWRDPTECCRSAARAARKNRFFAQRGMMQRILFGAETFALGVEELFRQKRNLCEVVYDELVSDPERELRRVCEFLKIPFEPTMLDLKSADVSSVPSGEHHGGVRSGVIGKLDHGNEILPPELVAKGDRYAQLWRERFPQLGFARALPKTTARPPGAGERVADGFVKSFWRGIDGFKKFLFRHIPISWWEKLRSRPRR